MKKLITSILILSLATPVWAAEGQMLQTDAKVTMDGVEFPSGTKGTKIERYTYDHAINVNGTIYPKGTEFTVLKTSAGEFVPLSATKVAAAGGATTGAATIAATTTTTVAGVSTTAIVTGAVIAGAVAVAASSSTSTAH